MSIFSFDATPPDVAYGNPSFFIGVLFKEDKYHNECRQFARKLVAADALVALSPLGLDEIWFAALRLLAIRNFGERDWQRILKNDAEIVKKYAHAMIVPEINVYTCNPEALRLIAGSDP